MTTDPMTAPTDDALIEATSIWLAAYLHGERAVGLTERGWNGLRMDAASLLSIPEFRALRAARGD